MENRKKREKSMRSKAGFLNRPIKLITPRYTKNKEREYSSYHHQK